MNVLIVDDSNLLQLRLIDILEECDFVKHVGQAMNTLEAEEFINKHNLDVVISDIRMPGGGGLDLLQFINQKYPAIKVIIMTNYPYPQYKVRALELGAKYFLSKTDEIDKLVDVLNEINGSMQNLN